MVERLVGKEGGVKEDTHGNIPQSEIVCIVCGLPQEIHLLYPPIAGRAPACRTKEDALAQWVRVKTENPSLALQLHQQYPESVAQGKILLANGF